VPTTENITVLFTDLVGSTELSASLSPEASDDVRRRHFSALRQAIATSGGTEVKNLGDGLMVVFPVASAALSCAVAMQQVVQRDNAGGETVPRAPGGVELGRGEPGGRRLLRRPGHRSSPPLRSSRGWPDPGFRPRASERRSQKPRTPSRRSENWS
jgi:class 3 adenylate cyclase